MYTVFYFYIFHSLLSAQNLLNRPESVVYDSLFNRYLVSNWATGNIVQIDSSGVQSYFVTGLGNINGIYISNNIVFAGCITKVRGFNLSTRNTVMDLLIPGAINLNDVTADNSGNIYITDFNAKKIIKVNIQSHAYSTFVSRLTLEPNGILFDDPNNRLLLCSFGENIPILAISLEDSSVSVVANTSLKNCDGFTKDDYGNYYISSWATKSIYKFDSAFGNPPELFYSNSEAPADISYNNLEDIIAAPIMNQNRIVYLSVSPESVESISKIPQTFMLFQNYPNPFNPITKIIYQIPELSFVALKVYDVLGNEIATLVNEEEFAEEYEVEFNASELPSGVYFYQLKAGSFSLTKKMLFLK